MPDRKPGKHFTVDAMSTEQRKWDQIRICLERDVQFREKTTWMEDVHLVHSALPELSFDEIDVETTFLRSKLKLPFVIEPMTGGTPEAAEINSALAQAAEALGVAMGVGSQRAAIEDPAQAKTFRIAREKAPNAFLIANIGAVQLAEKGLDYVRKAIGMIEANALSVHLNPLQEAVQPSGERRFKDALKSIKRAAKDFEVPIIVKEAGCGLSGEIGKKLEGAGVDAVDVAGAGGTSWAAVEYYRAKEGGDTSRSHLGTTFWDWGIPTAASLVELRASTKLMIIASGGMRSGLDAAKAIALGADAVGFAHPLLWPATMGVERVKTLINQYEEGLKVAMLLVGAKNLKELKGKQVIISGKLKSWLEQRNIKRTRNRRSRRRK